VKPCLECGKPLPPRKERGHRERDYCSDVCRQRAWRKRSKPERDLERARTEALRRMWDATEQHIHHETWQDDLASNEKLIKLLLDEIAELRRHSAILLRCIESLENDVADKEAEIVRLTILLETQAKRKRPG
jgi:hypothetical protein